MTSRKIHSKSQTIRTMHLSRRHKALVLRRRQMEPLLDTPKTRLAKAQRWRLS